MVISWHHEQGTRRDANHHPVPTPGGGRNQAVGGGERPLHQQRGGAHGPGIHRPPAAQARPVAMPETVRKTYKEKLRPTPTQKRALDEVLWRCRELYNTPLEQRITACQPRHVSVSRYPHA